MNKLQFDEQFGRLSKEWPRAYGESKKEIFAREFAGHEYVFFKLVVDRLLRKFRYAPQATDVWSAISEVQGEVWRQDRKKSKPNNSRVKYESDLPRSENLRRFKLLNHYIANRELMRKDPDWLRRNIWPNETKEESERKYAQIEHEIRREKKRKGVV